MDMQDIYRMRFIDGAEMDEATRRGVPEEDSLERSLTRLGLFAERDGLKRIHDGHILIHQDIAGSAYFEATTQHGTIAKSHLCNLQDALRWIYLDHDLTFSTKLVEIKRRLNCSDA